MFGADPRVYQTTVKSIIADDSGAVTAVETVKLDFSPDPNTGRSVMKQVPGSEKTVPAQLVLIAAGFLGASPETADAFGAAVGERGCISTAEGGYHCAGNLDEATSAGLFTAGDMVKYQLLPEQDILRRYCWYGYYLCELSMPLLFLRIAGATDNYENASKPPKWLLACFTINAALMALVFTNEFHQLVFQFNREDFIRTGDYSYNIGYYIVYSVMMAETIATLMIYIYKAYQSHVRKAYLFPILTCALMIAYPVGYAVGFISNHTDYTVTMLEKTGFADSVELAFYMITNGWINPNY